MRPFNGFVLVALASQVFSHLIGVGRSSLAPEALGPGTAWPLEALEGLSLLQFAARGERRQQHASTDPDEISVDDRFALVKERFMRHFSAEGRQEKTVSRSALSLDYEVQPMCRLISTPEVLLERGHMDLDQANEDSLVLLEVPSRLPLFPKVSEYFEVGLDGKGTHSPHRQILAATMELGSVTMTPRQVLSSPFLEEMQEYIATLRAVEPGDPVPGGSALIEQCVTEEVAEATAVCRKAMRDSSSRAFARCVTEEVRKRPEDANGCKGDSNCCYNCEMQFTVGIDVARVGELFELSDVKRVASVRAAIDRICSDEGVRCSPEYRGLLTLSAWTLRQVHESGVLKTCNNPKLAMKPWLVRTHFGDLFRAVQEMHGPDHLKDFQRHVMQASRTGRDNIVFRDGLMDYLNFPEMAEMAGYVASRDRGFSERLNSSEPMPITKRGLTELAQQMIDGSDKVDAAMLAKPCGVWGRSNDANSFTVGDWLDGVVAGEDIMSDADSPITKNSFSGLVWKSMGSWRMNKHDSRVYLECRNPTDCLSSLSPPFKSPAALGRLVAEAMAEFEEA